MVREDATASDIPDKAYFRIGEVSRLVGVDTHVLRYWESEFTIIKPFRGKSKQRLYRRQDVETLLRVRQLLHGEGYTIAGAKKALISPRTIQRTSQEAPPATDNVTRQSREICAIDAVNIIEHIRVELAALSLLLTKK
ncbi:MAG: MerR family transcriptional regulator [Desulfobulbaceae bacterium]|nr:MerR family transcriptional regulator [Desulfobulbaceae bacterium]